MSGTHDKHPESSTPSPTEISRLEGEMNASKRAYHNAKLRYEEALIAAEPFKPGDVIRSSKGTLARVVSVDIKWGSPRIFAVLRNKDGNFGKKPASMWGSEWEKPEIVHV